jgi:D-amino-acid oxidase
VEILIIGCGVSGLSTGVRLLEAGHRVTTWAKDLPPNTTSNVAAAVWHPFKAAPAEKLAEWSAVSFQVFKQLLATPECGILMRSVLELRPTREEPPAWSRSVDSFRLATPEELLPGAEYGHVFEAPVIDTSMYMDWLLRLFQSKGGQVVQRAVADMSEAFAQHRVVVNCAGLGARELLNDHDLRPARGQVVRIKATGFNRGIVEDDGPEGMAYIIPRVSDIVLGGTYEEGVERTEVDAGQTAGIIQRCARLAPQFASVSPADIVSVACGLRPVRSVVRVEAERLAPDRLLLHNYGHGGAGITLSWGCAQEVVALLNQAQID